ncbi:ATP-binding protein [Candidatus Bathyarchaeota archaeon]|nr:ATP-binding protein [Candidatus Bathyarchaeota archaeon]
MRVPMRVMVCGKGGTGKTAITVLASRILSEYFKVYVVDSDESNILLPYFLGVEPPKPLIDYIGGKREEEEMERALPKIISALAKAREGIRLNLLPKEYIATSREGISLMTIGKVREYGEGCACPFNILARALLSNLKLMEDEFVLVDTDAGVEHVGRRIEEACDGLLVIVDPTIESLETALMLNETAKKLNKDIWIIANKVTEDIKEALLGEAARLGLKIDGVVRFDRELYISCLRKEPIKSSTAINDLREIIEGMWRIKV